MSSDFAELAYVPVSVQQLINCSFSNWYPKFKDYTCKSEIIKPLPQEFIAYLEQDGIRLANENDGGSFYYSTIERNEENEYSDWEESEKDGEEDRTENNDPLTLFPELHKSIKNLINKHGAVTPKLNWSSPKDATWILPNNTLKCNEPNDIYLLLNSSNYITHDLDSAFDECEDKHEGEKYVEPELILRSWFNINPALEFRVFVKNKKVVGVSQRDLNYYDYLEPLKDTFKDLIDEFIEDVAVPTFPDHSFVCDLYIPRPFEKVWVVDFNPFARKTDSLLFSWNEIFTKNPEDDQDYELRLIKEHNIGRFASKEHSENYVPKDVTDASFDSQAIQELARKWSELLKMQQDEKSSDDEE
ncbi:LAFE_0B03224g1_1 [Lachancea fermentati]|uniref:Translation initiation factor eIF2 assembly protein n=1 Tax=Lachancea fermentati TaxID=4955 RepID=A0A1G4M7K0_LACFM|nr:LAFE_0B03224g1_1 [Lachancea fermentati]